MGDPAVAQNDPLEISKTAARQAGTSVTIRRPQANHVYVSESKYMESSGRPQLRFDAPLLDPGSRLRLERLLWQGGIATG